MSTSQMLRPIFSVAGRNNQAKRAGVSASRSFATQSGDDAAPPTALAKLHLEDGTTLTAKSFGCHTSVEGEVRTHEKNCLLGFLWLLVCFVWSFFLLAGWIIFSFWLGGSDDMVFIRLIPSVDDIKWKNVYTLIYRD